MCFTPGVSLFTALVEFVLAATILYKFRRSASTVISAVFLVLLGLYQLTEFMLCTTGAQYWILAGFLAYNFLPAMGLHYVYIMLKKKGNILLFYAMPLVYTLIAFLPGFVQAGSCEKSFIIAKTWIFPFSSANIVVGGIYWLYYISFILASVVIIFLAYRKERSLFNKRVELIGLIGVLLLVLSTLFYFLIFPTLGIKFPSVFCQFALFVGITLFISEYLKRDILYG